MSDLSAKDVATENLGTTTRRLRLVQIRCPDCHNLLLKAVGIKGLSNIEVKCKCGKVSPWEISEHHPPALITKKLRYDEPPERVREQVRGEK